MIVYCFFIISAFFLGAVIGSFLNVCIIRLPEGRSIVSPPSHCPTCQSPIRFYDNIPVFSYILLRGKCRGCGERISPRYPLVEFLTGCLSVLLLFRFGLSLSYGVYLIFISSLVVITFIDIDHRIIPDKISLPAIPIGFTLSFLLPELTWLQSLIGILVGGGSLLLVAVVYEAIAGVEGMGGGDIKLLAMLGAFLGWEGVLFTIMASSIIGTVAGGGYMILSGKGRKAAVPFGPFLSIGALIYLLWGELIIRWYLGTFV
ncbi:MAG: prepilin peptidase [Proteobacteria bacterium]|nr:prepilin peptidase [Pseudomonadota bacterium]